MPETGEKDRTRWPVRPGLLWPFLAIMLLGQLAAALLAFVERDLGQGLHVAGLLSMGWFFYRNPRILTGPPLLRLADMRAAVDVEFLWLSFALMFAGQFVFRT